MTETNDGIKIAHAVFCAILFACSAVLLGLTAYHVHFTETMFSVSFYVPIVVELLVTSCLAILASSLGFIIASTNNKNGKGGFGVEMFLLSVIWIMYLVGACVFSRGWHNISWCVGSRHVCRILSAIIAFSWINWVLTMGVMIVCGVHMGSPGEEAGQTTHTATTPVTEA